MPRKSPWSTRSPPSSTAADAAIITEYRGMSVGQLATLRRQLRNSGGEYKVYKNTLARFGAEKAGIDGLAELLIGPSAITFISGDAAGVAKALKDAARTNPFLIIKGGAMGGKSMSAKDIEGARRSARAATCCWQCWPVPCRPRW